MKILCITYVIEALYSNMSVSHICDGQKTCFPTMLQTSFFAHEIISLKLSKTQDFRKMRQFLNRAIINGLIILTFGCILLLFT